MIDKLLSLTDRGLGLGLGLEIKSLALALASAAKSLALASAVKSLITTLALLPSEGNNEVLSIDYVTPLNTLSLLLEQKDTSPSSTTPWPTTKNNDQK